MKLQPTNDYILIEPSKEKEITKGGILIPETAREEKSMRGKVISVGPGKLNEKGERVAVSVKEGQNVVFKKYSPDEVKIDDKEYYFIREEDILAIIG
ncbi:MAG: co-chaperone GroES [Patescibacteria group bacterium]